MAFMRSPVRSRSGPYPLAPLGSLAHPVVRQVGIAFGSPYRLDSRLVHQHIHNQGSADCVSVEQAQIAERDRVTMSYMKTSTITIRLDDALGRALDQACARTGRTRSELARDALRRQLALLRFERLRKRTLPLAESQGYLTDEDIFRDVS